MQEHSVARRAMIDSQLRPQGVTDGGVLAAMGALPRENYVPEAARAFAYFDRPLKIGAGRAMMPPAALGRLLSELAPRAGERALVVGAATGYSSALLKLIGLAVTATEDDASLAATAAALGVDIAASDDGAAFDLILIDGAIEYIPEELAGRLVEGGRLGTALLDRGVSRLVVGRAASGRLGLRTIVDADVAPLPGFERARAFTF
jgi:protein-L-isoaspartate(D-aspartate) O-methyltransferase